MLASTQHFRQDIANGGVMPHHVYLLILSCQNTKHPFFRSGKVFNPVPPLLLKTQSVGLATCQLPCGTGAGYTMPYTGNGKLMVS